MISTDKIFDVVIVGAGLVGASLALAILNNSKNKDLKLAIVDKTPGDIEGQLESQLKTKENALNSDQPTFNPRVVALTPSSIVFLKSLGVWEAIKDRGVCNYNAMQVWDDEGTGCIRFDAKEFGLSTLGTIAENHIIQTSLISELQGHKQITLLQGYEVSNISPEDNKQRIILSDHQEIVASLLVAADGAHSKIRELSGLQVRSWDYQHKSIVTSVEHELSHDMTAWQAFRVSGPLAFLPLDHTTQRYSSIVWSIEAEQADKLMALSDKGFAHALSKAFEYKLGNISSIAKRHCFPLKQRHAIDYIAPQLALVGDAAHTIHPLAGQGVNLGLLDAAALASEITRASARQLTLSDESILRRYQRQRKKNNLEVMLLMEGFKRFFGSRDLLARWLRNTGLNKVDKLKPIKSWLAKQAMGL